LNNLLIWLIGHDHPDVDITSPVAGNSYSSNVSIEWNQSAYGGASIDSVFVEYSNNGGAVYYTIAKGTASEVSSPLTWDISNIPNGTNYMIRVRVKDTGVYPSLAGNDVVGPFTLDRSNGDMLGPMVVAGSIEFSKNPIGRIAENIPGNSVTITAKVTDVNRGDNNIAAAEWSVGDTAAAPGAGNALTAQDGSFDSVEEVVEGTITTDTISTGDYEWVAGPHNIWIRARDASPAKSANNWGEAQKATLNVVDNASTALTLTLFAANGVDKGVEVRWTTSAERGASKFIVERRAANSDKYETVAEVSAAGYSKSVRNYSVLDEEVEVGKTYYYRLTDVSTAGTKVRHPEVKVVAGGWAKPVAYGLYHNTPNPFKDATIINYAVPQRSEVEIAVYSVTGRLIKTLVKGEMEAGYYSVKWDGRDNNGKRVSQGVYFYKMISGDFSSVQKMTLVK